MATFSATSSSIEGFKLVAKHPAVLFVWGLFYLAAIALTIGLVVATAGPGFLDSMKNLGANAAASADPTAALKMVGSMMLAFLVAIPIFMVVIAMLNAAVFRAVLRPEEKGLAFLRFGGDELRLLAVAFLMFLLFMVLYFVCVFVAALLIGVTAGVNHGNSANAAGGLVGFLVAIVLICGFIFVAVKLSLAPVMTFAQRRIRIFESWTLTKGQFWPLLGMYLLVGLMLLGIAIVVALVSGIFTAMMGVGMFAMFSGHSPASQMAATGPMVIVGTVLYVLVTMLHSALQFAVITAPQAAAYRALTADTKAAEVF